ncbi:RNA polymerase sigma-70 factor, ECF subfamily [Variovorax sp. OK605]|jgi:RNA polymerase sigma factor (sigma-70 family)|uniref:sigma-70 family RNA polymerase sigma factor n=1 Tax=unclassified Variovorax TaxID=663243 RepID=UPI0008C53F65|nr:MULTISPECIES: sigma-70 family RNA polymerase sigma factor [unclassified Variovorax]SEK11394.1 RNA polymerase sigma-70 factor, ECF subfamily [Variovorax sp. OK202]SFD74254.1 RNA polymerase sigma-70 factor, ECF subfamily [Variovorax sp. OK212]SFP97623.1 RNA polymerase sigma-70 factor, ECF subfamily [Variovorax sp. OK605]
MSALPRAPSAKNALERQAMPDDQLMLAYAQGDAAAFDVLYARHEGGLFRFVKRLLGARLAAQADEVFQDTWVRIISARESFSPQGATWRTWAFTIAHNLAMDRLRVSGREVTLDAHADDDSDPVPTLERGVRGAVDAAAHPSAEELAFWRAAGRRLLACLDELPTDQRAAFLLHHEDGLTVEALASSLEIGFETVRSRLRYGLQKLRACMERYLAVLEQRA